MCRQVRTFSHAYVAMLTARSDEVDKPDRSRDRADDYMTKPFSPRELTAGVRAMLRCPRSSRQARQDEESELRTLGRLQIDALSREVWLDGTPLELLTRTQFDLLGTLSARHRK